MKDKKKWVIGLLCTLVCIMAVGYALLAQQLNINGSASIDSTWKVEITNIQESEVVGKATSKVTPSYTSTTANFSVSLTQPGDGITYDVEISNLGTLDAKVDSININVDENDAIKYTTSGVVSGDKLSAGEKATLAIKVEYDSSVTSQPSITTSNITITINYVQDLGEESTVTYQTYSVGDTVSFAGSNWYVIKNSTSEEDYVTLLKETVLTNSELGDYAAVFTDTCTSSDIIYGGYDCTEGEITKVTPLDAMSYYWSDTCHIYGYYGYTDSDESGCSGHNDYEGSKVKEFLEGTYINTLGSENLKEVDNYKVRLITKNEVNNYIDLSYNGSIMTITTQENCPSWVVFNDIRYWTMSPITDYNSAVWYVGYHTGGTNVVRDVMAVRPVINLLKSSI